ncbi:hypothetical protein FE257_010959 [Aspergillus nanangensis]|uniref:DNA repair metallo-beta-lactamase domain-containing protein n=1 Tax=Aspergillus nanangensis TaxID=2582783 RepID=A0AAD4CWB1_ASPNN|nr:hypothetical protein FE257_010959 [Aspergillus nanangensis]
MAGPFGRKTSTPAKSRAGSKTQGSAKKNTSLLNFFQKTDGPPQATSRQSRITQFVTKTERSATSGSASPSLHKENSSNLNGSAGGLFLEDPKGSSLTSVKATTTRARSPTPDDIWGDSTGELSVSDDVTRFNENGSAVKKRKVDSPEQEDVDVESVAVSDSPGLVAAKSRHVNGPFIDESDSENELEGLHGFEEKEEEEEDTPKSTDLDLGRKDDKRPSAAAVPALVREDTSYLDDDEYTNFDDLEEDEFDGQKDPLDQIDEEEGAAFGFDDSTNSLDIDENDHELRGEEVVCPVCQAPLGGMNEADVSMHVNDCLDGKPRATPPTTAPTPYAEKPWTIAERAAVPRPAQRDPYSAGASKPKSAFSWLMAGNAEDTAWTAAATNETASRGKQAYQRTCPFYKILTGFAICVDAFRYGAVEGCNAYFLSHFHSDHYIGLKGSWHHGPIYCSRATGNLVRQQLKVNARWVVDLEFEQTVEVPETGGVRVTLIEANHCPGSALFLFEKPMGSGAACRLQRVLHCGDFRASPAHVQHPLLRPDIVDATTGQKRVQRIDTCYLDTTYLSPKYAFPAQGEVIQACVDLCVDLNHGHGVVVEQGAGGSSTSNNTGDNMMGKFLASVTRTNRASEAPDPSRGRLLVVIGTYSIGKERLCLGIAKSLRSKIYATAAKQRICACLEDAELSSLLTDNPHEAQVHMQTLFEIRAETLADYLDSLKPHFSRVVGFRPTGWTYRPPAGRLVDNPPVSTVLHSAQWQTRFTRTQLISRVNDVLLCAPDWPGDSHGQRGESDESGANERMD